MDQVDTEIRNISIVTVVHNKRFYGTSNFTLTKSVSIFISYFSVIIQLAMPNIFGKIFNKISKKPQNIISETTFNKNNNYLSNI